MSARGADARNPRDGRSFLNDGERWSVSERDATKVPGAHGPTCLVFESQGVVRRAWSFPRNWRDMEDGELWRLSELAVGNSALIDALQTAFITSIVAQRTASTLVATARVRRRALVRRGIPRGLTTVQAARSSRASIQPHEQAHEMSKLGGIPNLLSFSRIFLAILFVPAGYAARIALIFLAGATDFLDGWLARRTRATTRWGALIDPLADRLFVFVAIVTYVINGKLSLVQSLLLLPRDIATALAFVVARMMPTFRAVEFKARFSGKIVTVLQLATLLALAIGVRRLTPLIMLVAFASVIAIVDYGHAVLTARVE